MAMVTVYRFRAYDVASDQMRSSRGFATREAIEKVAHGQVLEATATCVDDNEVGGEIPGMTAIDYSPPADRTVEFQRQVR